jgi:hypothetical protein
VIVAARQLPPIPQAPVAQADVLRATGIRHVIRVLELAEAGSLPGSCSSIRSPPTEAAWARRTWVATPSSRLTGWQSRGSTPGPAR